MFICRESTVIKGNGQKCLANRDTPTIIEVRAGKVEAVAQQTLWEAMKQEAQSAFNQIGTSYQDILIHGRLMSHGSMDRHNALNMEIAEAGYHQIEKAEPYPEPEIANDN